MRHSIIVMCGHCTPSWRYRCLCTEKLHQWSLGLWHSPGDHHYGLSSGLTKSLVTRDQSQWWPWGDCAGQDTDHWHQHCDPCWCWHHLLSLVLTPAHSSSCQEPETIWENEFAVILQFSFHKWNIQTHTRMSVLSFRWIFTVLCWALDGKFVVGWRDLFLF